MQRPYVRNSIDELEAIFEQAEAVGNFDVLRLLAHELTFRKTSRARELKVAASQLIAKTNPSISPGGAVQRQVYLSPSNDSPRAPVRQMPKPTSEQAEAIEFFLKGGSLKINAYAGTGKTSTLVLLSHNTPKQGQYIAFNRSIVRDAKQKFPASVNCSTVHSLALKSTPSKYRVAKDKLFGKINANQLVEILGIKKNWRIDKDHTLHPRSQAFLILETIRRFTHSMDFEATTEHVPRHGSLVAAPEATISAVSEFAVKGARYVWARMQDENDPVPLGHDGYLKLWALSEPMISADFILLDEAQDTNPVVLGVLGRQTAQMVYVGDKYQQIYEWRGAVNAMEKIDTDYTTFLTTSFRFGDTIAEAATRVLSNLGEKRPLRGNPKVQSRIGSVAAHTILARTNASTITAIIEALDIDKRPHLVGGNAELMEMLRGVQDLKNSQPSTVADFFGFENWQQVVEFAKSGEGEHLLTFVNLVESRGERQLMWALNRTVEEEQCDVVVSTAHKAKGCEWKTVRLMDDFLKSRPKKVEASATSFEVQNNEKNIGHDPSELRLFYVALTRAKSAIDIPQPLLSLFGLQSANNRPVKDQAEITHAQQKLVTNTTESPVAKKDQTRSPTVEWKPQVDWQPDSTDNQPVSPPRPRSENTSAIKRKGLLGWLFQ
jgi:hypothetical protein